MENNTQPNNFSSELVVGLDIGTTKIAAIVGQKNEHGKVTILGIGKTESLGVNRGVVVNIEQTVASIKAAIALAANAASVDIGDVVVGIAGQHIKSMQHRGMLTRQSLEDEVSQKDIDTLIDSITNKIFDAGLNLNDKPTFEREIGSIISYSHNDLINKIYNYKGI